MRRLDAALDEAGRAVTLIKPKEAQRNQSSGAADFDPKHSEQAKTQYSGVEPPHSRLYKGVSRHRDNPRLNKVATSHDTRKVLSLSLSNTKESTA